MALFKRDIALMVLQYLDDEGLSNVYRLFCQHSKYLRVEYEALQKGLQRANYTRGLVRCLMEHARVEAVIRDFIKNEDIKGLENESVQKKLEHVLRYFRPRYNQTDRKRKRRALSFDENEKGNNVCAPAPPKKFKETNDSYYSLRAMDTETETHLSETDHEVTSNTSNTSFTTNPNDLPHSPRVSPTPEDEIVLPEPDLHVPDLDTIRDALLDMPDIPSCIAEKINQSQPAIDTDQVNPKGVVEELEKDGKLYDVIEELLEISALQQSIKVPEDVVNNKNDNIVVEQRELRQRKTKINYKDAANGKIDIVNLKETRRKKQIPKKNVDPIEIEILSDVRIIETINENGEKTKKEVKVNPDTYRSINRDSPKSKVPPMVEIPFHVSDNLGVDSTENQPMTSIQNSIPALTKTTSVVKQPISSVIVPPAQLNPMENTVQIEQESDQQQIFSTTGCQYTPSGNTVILEMSPKTFQLFADTNPNVQELPMCSISNTVPIGAGVSMVGNEENTNEIEKNENILKEVTPGGTQRITVSRPMSTPSRKSSHIRFLKFKSPLKEIKESTEDDSSKEAEVTVVEKSATKLETDVIGTTTSRETDIDVIEGDNKHEDKPSDPQREDKNKERVIKSVRRSKKRSNVKKNNSEKADENVPDEPLNPEDEWNRIRAASKGNWDQHIRELNRHKEVSSEGSNERGTRRKSRGGELKKTKSNENGDKIYFKVPTPSKKVRPTPQLTTPQNQTKSPVKSINDSLTIPSTSTPNQVIVSPPLNHNDSSISLITVQTSSLKAEPFQISLTQLASVLPDTPFKDSFLNVPVTPQISTETSVQTPFTKLLNELDLHSIIKNTEIQTPLMAKTPGSEIILSPKSTESKLASGYSSRATDYSSGSSYYKPDDIDSKLIEQAIIAEQKVKNMKVNVIQIAPQKKEPIPGTSCTINLDPENILDRTTNGNRMNSELISPERRARQVAELEEKKARTIRILQAQSKARNSRDHIKKVPPKKTSFLSNELRKKRLQGIPVKRKTLTPKKITPPPTAAVNEPKRLPVKGPIILKKIKFNKPLSKLKSDEIETPKPVKLMSNNVKKRNSSQMVPPVQLSPSSSSSSSSSSDQELSSTDSDSSDSELDETKELQTTLITSMDTSRFFSIQEDPTYQRKRLNTDAPKLRSKAHAFQLKDKPDKIIKLTTSDVINLYECRPVEERRKRTSSANKSLTRQKESQVGFEYVISPNSANTSPVSSSTPLANNNKICKPKFHIHSKYGEEIVVSPKTARMPLKIDMKQNQLKHKKLDEIMNSEQDVKSTDTAIDTLLNHLHPS